jgi:formylglycine-generating enzyme required for sulfatase activity
VGPVKRLICLALALLAPVTVQSAQSRFALVIGNSAYTNGRLPNPVNDAKLIGETLNKLGFKVITKSDADYKQMKQAIEDFGGLLDRGGRDAVGVFYYAGHGVQLNGRNYLIPVDARIERVGDLDIEGVSADWVIDEMSAARNGLNIVILDACRDNPFANSMRSVGRGLAWMQEPTGTTGILIAYSTAPGSVARDGNGRNSPYTMALSEAMLGWHEPLESVFRHVRNSVMKATADKQVPWETSSLVGEDFYFIPPEKAELRVAGGAAPAGAGATASGPPLAGPALAPPPAGAGTASVPAEKHAAGGFSSWLSSLFGAGPSADAGSAAPQPAPAVVSNRPRVSGGTGAAAIASNPVTPANGSADIAGPAVSGARVVAMFDQLGIDSQHIDAARSFPQAAIRVLLQSAPRHVTLGSTPAQVNSAFALCRQYAAHCERSWYSEDEGVRHATLKPFQLDALPVSVRAFRDFATRADYTTHAEKVGFAFAVRPGGTSVEQVDGGSWRNGLKRHPAEDDSPVVGVDFWDAKAYCDYKSARLPSEDEWEYVARGPTRSVFPWGDNPAPVARTMSVAPRVADGPAEGIGGRYRGLVGNVWQWVDTPLHGRCDPADPNRVMLCMVLKGGSWLENNPANKRAAFRRYDSPTTADEDTGFRCARSVSTWPDADLWLSQLERSQ